MGKGSRRWVDGVLLLLVSAAGGAAYMLWRASDAESSPPSIAAVDEPLGVGGRGTGDGRALPTERTPLPVARGAKARKGARSGPVRRPQRLPRRRAREGIAETRRPTQLEIEAEMDHVSVTMYGTRWCPVCAKARAWMSSNGYHFNELDVDANESAKEARDRLAPKGGVPVFLIGGQLLDGFSPGAFEQTLRRAAEKQLRR